MLCTCARLEEFFKSKNYTYNQIPYRTEQNSRRWQRVKLTKCDPRRNNRKLKTESRPKQQAVSTKF